MEKILFYINELGHGGAERVISTLANNMSDNNEVYLLTSNFVNSEYPLKSSVNRVSLFKQRISSSFVVRNIKLIYKLRQTIKKCCPDVAVSFMGEPNFRLLIATLGLKCKKIISVRNDPNREYSGFVRRFLAKNLFKLADVVVFQTKEAQSWFSDSIQKKSVVIWNPIADKFLQTSISSERHGIVATGRLVSQKNHKLLIEAFSKLAPYIEDNLTIYGEGELRKELETYIKQLDLSDRVFLPGQISDIPNAIRNARLYVMSSDYEGMPNALMEAMAMGLACVSTDCPCGGPRELIQDGVNGLFVPVGDVEAMYLAMKRVVEEPGLAERLGKEAYKIREVCSIDKIARQWLDVMGLVESSECEVRNVE